MLQAGKQRFAIIACFLLLVSVAPFALSQTQPRPEWTGATDDRISLSETLTLEQAFKLIGEMSQKLQGKIIIDKSGKTARIGVEIVNMGWRRALETICRKNELEYEEGGNYIQVINPLTKNGGGGKDADLVDVTNREVIIEAVFFEADRNAMREMGVNWSSLYQGDVTTNIEQITAPAVSDNNIFTLSVSKQINNTMKVAGVVKTFQNSGKGSIIANPQIRVRSGKTGYVQVGQDFSIKTKDFAGNTIDNFVSAGTILQVTPQVIVDRDVTFINLKLDVERSTGNVSALTTTINKSKASTMLLMLPSEEAAIGGLYTTEKEAARMGIPFLKDLPWWVLGIRYLAGYERERNTEKELVILLKVDLEPDLATRIKNYRKEHGLENARRKAETRQEQYWNEVEKEK